MYVSVCKGMEYKRNNNKVRHNSVMCFKGNKHPCLSPTLNVMYVTVQTCNEDSHTNTFLNMYCYMYVCILTFTFMLFFCFSFFKALIYLCKKISGMCKNN